MTEYRTLREEDIDRELFRSFVRRQVVDLCLRLENGEWVARQDPFIDYWSESDYQILVKCLRNTVRTGGYVCGAFSNGVLKGFVSVEKELFGGENMYHDLTSIHVSQDMRRTGIGKELFMRAAAWAKDDGAKKLYISSHSAIESQAFYRAMGCVDAAERDLRHTSAEPYDRQLEYAL